MKSYGFLDVLHCSRAHLPNPYHIAVEPTPIIDIKMSFYLCYVPKRYCTVLPKNLMSFSAYIIVPNSFFIFFNIIITVKYENLRNHTTAVHIELYSISIYYYDYWLD